MAFIISFCILIIINLVYSYFQNVDLGVWLKKDKYEEAFIIEEEFNEKIKQINENWNIKIPKIELEASIAEGVSADVLNEYVGHFENSGTDSCNICLKAYSSGNDVNYFENIKKLRSGDEIYYTKDGITFTYIVEFTGVINSDDLSFLEQGDDNMISLFTNIENESGYLRCVQAFIDEEE